MYSKEIEAVFQDSIKDCEHYGMVMFEEFDVELLKIKILIEDHGHVTRYTFNYPQDPNVMRSKIKEMIDLLLACRRK